MGCASSTPPRPQPETPSFVKAADLPPFHFEDARIGRLSLTQLPVQERGDGGLWVWLAGLQLARWLCSSDGVSFLSQAPRLTSAIELGCGSGLIPRLTQDARNDTFAASMSERVICIVRPRALMQAWSRCVSPNSGPR
jgi:hypothetical protein